jgi:hypothetical protein
LRVLKSPDVRYPFPSDVNKLWLRRQLGRSFSSLNYLIATEKSIAKHDPEEAEQHAINFGHGECECIRFVDVVYLNHWQRGTGRSEQIMRIAGKRNGVRRDGWEKSAG